MKTLLFMGYSNSGKTSAMVRVVRQLVKAGHKVGTLKHIHDRGFTMDTRWRDTWRHGTAGASTVVALAPRELTIMERGDTGQLTIEELMGIFRKRGVDCLLIEGLHRRLSRRRGLTRIACARSKEEARQLLRGQPRPVCIVNRGRSREEEWFGIPVLKLPRDLPPLMGLIGMGPRATRISGRGGRGARESHRVKSLAKGRSRTND